MKEIIELEAAGFTFTVKGEKVSYRWTRPDPPDPQKVGPLLAELKAKKEQVREYLTMQLGRCESCPANGYWDGYGQWKMAAGRYCFHSAYFMGKAAKPVQIAEAQAACPKTTRKEI